MAQKNLYSFDEGLRILRIMGRLTGLCENSTVSYQVCEGSTCVNGANSADGSFLLTLNTESLEENLLAMEAWVKKEITKPARAQ